MMYRIIAASVLMGAASLAIAQDVPENPVCELQVENGQTKFVLCPEGLESAEMAGEGKAICGDLMPCGAWIFTDAAVIPDTAPDSPDGMDQEVVLASHGVWINEASRFMIIKVDE